MSEHTKGEMQVCLDTFNIADPPESSMCSLVVNGDDYIATVEDMDEWEANAKRIALTWNMHDELVEALETGIIFSKSLKHTSSIWNGSDSSDLNKMEQTLAKVKEKI